jgi:hypothetical protein
MNEIVGALDRAFALIEGHPKPNFHRLRSGPPAAVTEVFSKARSGRNQLRGDLKHQTECGLAVA